MDQAYTDIVPGAVTPYGVVAYRDGQTVWLYTIAGVRAYRLADFVAVPKAARTRPPRPARARVISQLRLVA